MWARCAAILVCWALAGTALADKPFPETCAELDPSCHTVVVFGDTQDLTDSDPASPIDGAQRLATMVQWILDNKDVENIAFVLHVGDITENGHTMPASATSCLAGDPPGGECLEALCDCTGSANERKCCPARVEQEWTTFNSEFARLELAGIPYAIVTGGHDNPFGSTSPLDTPGFRDYYGPSVLAALPGYLSTHVDSGGCISNAWEFQLGTDVVLVVGITDAFPEKCPESAAPPGEDNTHLLWARSLIDRPEHQDKQVIVLTHRLFNGVAGDGTPRRIWRELVGASPERFLAGVWGHLSPGGIGFVEVAKTASPTFVDILRVRTDWQDRDPATLASNLNLMRFHFDPDGTDQVEIAAWNAPDGTVGGANWAPDELEATAYSIYHDLDGDGVLDLHDNCPLTPNPSQVDTDGDERPDECDNCPLVWNPRQRNSDGDRAGDACESDADGDGIVNRDDLCPEWASVVNVDSNGDGLADPCQCGDLTGDGYVDQADVDLAAECANDPSLCSAQVAAGIGSVLLGGSSMLHPSPDAQLDDVFESVDSDRIAVGVILPGMRLICAASSRDFDDDMIFDAPDPCPFFANEWPLPAPAAAGDEDGDGIPTECDPCRSFSNLLPLNAGSCDPATPNSDCNSDGIPAECQCGDANGNGAPDTNDLSAIFGCLSGGTPAPTCAAALAGGNADVNHNRVFDNNDLTRIYSVLVGALPSHALTCANRPEGTPMP